MSHLDLSHPGSRHPDIRHPDMFHPNIRFGRSHQGKVCRPEIRHPDMVIATCPRASLCNLLRGRYARALIPLAVRQVLSIKKSGASNPMIVGRLRVIDLSAKEGQGKQQNSGASLSSLR